VFAAEQLQQGSGKIIHRAGDDVLAALEPAGLQPTRHIAVCLHVAIRKIKYQETLHAAAVDQQRHVIGRAGHSPSGDVLVYRPADDDASTPGQIGQGCVQNGATDIVEVDVDAVRAVLTQAASHVIGLVIDGGIKAQFFLDIAAFPWSAGDADHATALDTGDL